MIFGSYGELLTGQTDGSGEDEISPMSNSIDRSVRSQFCEQRGPSDRSTMQQDMDYQSTTTTTTTTTLWSNSSRYVL